MECPKCGSENPDDTKVCGSCSFTWTGPDQGNSRRKAGNCLMLICGVFLIVLGAGLTFFVTLTLGFFVELLGFCTAISGLVRNWNKKQFKRESILFAIAFNLSWPVLILSYLSIDAASIGNDYTISDLRSAPPECDQTYDLLGSLAEVDTSLQGISAIGLSAREIDQLEEINRLCKGDDLQSITQQLQANAENILKIWQNAQKGREVLAKLDSFPEIADLKEPDLTIEAPWLVSIRHLAFLHRAYACLESSRGNHETAVDTLLGFDSFVRKLDLNARSVVRKLVCISCFAIVIDTANFIINNPETSQKSLLLLRQRMAPLEREHASLRNALICEYLDWKNEFVKMSNKMCSRDKYFSNSRLKLNSSLRLCRNFIDRLLVLEEDESRPKKLRVWPTLYPNLPAAIRYDGKLPWYYKIYNPVGTLTIGILAPAMMKVCLIRTKLQIHSDLLRIVLDKRLGREVSLKARAYGEEYIIDVENKKIFSPGPDGEAGTKDDIVLPINPEVLGW